jgi:hypothetical protein
MEVRLKCIASNGGALHIFFVSRIRGASRREGAFAQRLVEKAQRSL